ncbi:MAG TPA: tetratricopeptide repeat protein [Gammaproteobacteria bacterium]|jgi:hypothetical protein
MRTLPIYMLLSLLSGCASDPTLSTPDPAASPQVTQAREVLTEQLTRSPFVSNVVFVVDAGQPRVINYHDPSTGNDQSVILVTLLPASIAVDFVPSPNAYTEAAWKISYTGYQDGHPYFWLWSGWSQADAQQIADALKVLVLDSRRDMDQSFAARYQTFLQSCQPWLGSKILAPFPEEARQHQLLAEDAANRNDLDKAMDEYAAAFKIAPCWAQGRYQDAMIEGQTGWYLVAVDDMRKYLQLVPDAPNAQAVKDQIIIWNGRMGIE